jgi:hypothetical protein
LKNFIGIQDDRHRMVDHNQYLEHKIADLQSVIQPKFIAIDAITAGQKMMLTPTPFDMGAIVMGTNSCAVDTVGCHMVHVNPKDLIHLRFASERGFGPADIDRIEVSGDLPLEELKEKTKDFQFCLERIDDYFGKESNLSCTVGAFPEAHSKDYCWGGCPGALQEAMHILRGFYPNVDREMGKIRYVVGKVEGPLELADNERVIFAGSCTSWEGQIHGENIKIESSYKTADEVDETRTKSNDMLLKFIGAQLHAFRHRSSSYLHVPDCPLSVAQHVNYLASMANIGNPNLDPRLLIPVNIGYYQMRWNRFVNRLWD